MSKYSNYRPVNVPKYFNEDVLAQIFNFGVLGTADNAAYTLTLGEKHLDSLEEGLVLNVKMPAANSAGAATLNVNGLGALKLIKASDQSTQIALDDLVANGSYQVAYNADLDSGNGAWIVLNV